jgi:hypothetical protein
LAWVSETSSKGSFSPRNFLHQEQMIFIWVLTCPSGPSPVHAIFATLSLIIFIIISHIFDRIDRTPLT